VERCPVEDIRWQIVRKLYNYRIAPAGTYHGPWELTIDQERRTSHAVRRYGLLSNLEIVGNNIASDRSLGVPVSVDIKTTVCTLTLALTRYARGR